MTDDQTLTDGRAEFETLSAFIDGERVDHDALKQALADPAGRDYLIDLLTLREAVAEMAPQAPAIAPRPTMTSRVVRLAGLAATLVLALAGGYIVGHRSQAPVVRPPASVIAAPAPTRVIRLEPGVNWVDDNGGSR